MRKILLVHVFICRALIAVALGICLLGTVANAQLTDPELGKMVELNRAALAKFQKGDYGDAIKLGKQAIDLGSRILGPEHREMATLYINIAESYAAKRDWRDAAKYLRMALDIFQGQGDAYLERALRVLDRLGTVLALDGRVAEAESILLENLANAEKRHGQVHKTVDVALGTLAAFYVHTRQLGKAENTYIRRYVLREYLERDLSKADFDLLPDVWIGRSCYFYTFYAMFESSEREKEFEYKLASELVARGLSEQTDDNDTDTVDVGVVNGKALSLPRPVYPREARLMGAGGVVVVRVMIDEKGKVESARVICGAENLRRVSEHAARKAKFQPTTLDGIPVKVTGVITYKFSPP